MKGHIALNKLFCKVKYFANNKYWTLCIFQASQITK